MRVVVENGYKLLILVGLPGSGKTKFAEELIAKGERENKAYDYIGPNLVELKKRLNDIKELGLEKVLRRNLRGSIRTDEILDGCLIGNEDLKLAINTVLDSKDFESVEIHYWKPNKEALLHNNTYTEDAKVETFELEPVNLEWLKGETEFPNIELIFHELELKAGYVLFAEKYDLRLISDGVERGKGKKYLTSDTWYLGGTSRDHDGGHYHSSGEEPLANFDVFDDLLMEVCPTISFLQYKKLYSSTVTIETRTESDYYSDSEYAFYSCNIEELVKQLVNMGIYTV